MEIKADNLQENCIGIPFKEGEDPRRNLKGRPKGKTIKEMVREWLEEHPDDMKAFVEHFVKKNKELAWQMMEGRPPQKFEGDKENPLIIQISKEIAEKNDKKVIEK